MSDQQNTASRRQPRDIELKNYPGPLSSKLLEELRHYVIAEPHPFVLDLPHCRGVRLATIDGQQILDMAGYYGAKLLGHNHPRLREPAYVERLVWAANNKTANPDFLTPECVDYYRLIYSLAPLCMRNPRLEVYAVNSGAEAVENMMKYFINLHDVKMRQRGGINTLRRFIYFDRAFHGRTIFALNITQLEHDPIVTRDFKGFIPGNIQVPFPHLDTDRSAELNVREATQSLGIIEDCLKRYRGEIVAIVVEPLQGAGGHRVSSKEFFQGLSRLAHQYDVYLGFDEVQTAGGQTGTIFACDQFDLPYPPQAIATAKKFGNGVVYMLYPMDDHGVLDSTWGGNLADMVRFVQEMKIIKEECLLEAVPEKSAFFVAGLRNLASKHSDLIFNVRGMGLYQGFSVRAPQDKSLLLDIALEQTKLLLLGAGMQTIRFRPPLDITPQDLTDVLARLDSALQTLRLQRPTPDTNAMSPGDE